MQMTLQRYESQSTLFRSKLSRQNIIDLSLLDETTEKFSITVWRNHAIESVIPLMEPYCLFGKWHAEFKLESYDDSLMFNNWQPADAELLWLDNSRLLTASNFDDWLDWLNGRLTFLRSISKSPIVLATWTLNEEQNKLLQQSIDRLPAVYYSDIKKTCEENSIELLDQRTAKLAGTPVSKSAQLVLARELACHWLPAALLPPIKAVAVDLDHTLHYGILGEDGIEGVQLTEEHKELQQFLKSLQQRGIFLALVSRNEYSDVAELFTRRQDYPLRWEDFSAIEVSWGDKAAALQRIAHALRIAPEAILFVDDNPGELASIAMQLPQTHTIHATPDASLTRRAISFYPGLWRWKVESDDTKRISDLKANVEREALAGNAISPSEYFRSLNVTLVYRHNPAEQLSRLADLCAKTNQFNLTLRRLNQSELADRISQEDACVASIQLTDRLSDSGVIAVIVAERKNDQLIVVELCISCRAMGRQLEDTIILSAIRGMPIFPGCREIIFPVQRGPRNQPALDWLARHTDSNTTLVAELCSIDARRLVDHVATEGITLIEE